MENQSEKIIALLGPTNTGKTHVAIEKMLEFYSKISTMKTTAIRHSNIFGPFDKYDLEKSHVLGATISKVMKAEKKSNYEKVVKNIVAKNKGLYFNNEIFVIEKK